MGESNRIGNASYEYLRTMTREEYQLICDNIDNKNLTLSRNGIEFIVKYNEERRALAIYVKDNDNARMVLDSWETKDKEKKALENCLYTIDRILDRKRIEEEAWIKHLPEE